MTRTYEAYPPAPVKLMGWRKGILAIKEKCAERYTEETHREFCEGCSNLERCRKAWDDFI